MIVINQEGQILQAWFRFNGPAIEDRDNKYNLEFMIGVLYNKKQKAQHDRMEELKDMLKQTDYKPLKYLDGDYTEEEYAQIKAERESWRTEIREIEKDFVEPTLTREEIDEAEQKAVKSLKDMIRQRTGKEVEEIEGA